MTAALVDSSANRILLFEVLSTPGAGGAPSSSSSLSLSSGGGPGGGPGGFFFTRAAVAGLEAGAAAAVLFRILQVEVTETGSKSCQIAKNKYFPLSLVEVDLQRFLIYKYIVFSRYSRGSGTYSEKPRILEAVLKRLYMRL